MSQPEPPIRAGRLGAVTAPYPASPPSEPAPPQVRDGGEGSGSVLLNKMSHIESLNISFKKYSQFFVHEPDLSSELCRSAL